MGVGLRDYEPIVGSAVLEELAILSERVRARRHLHVNSTRVGGGVAEILQRAIPLLQELGLEARWEVIEGSPEFFEVTKSFHNALQGQPVPISREMLDTYVICNYENSLRVSLDADVVYIHDPQPAAMVRGRREGQKWVWRCHIDLSHPQMEPWEYLRGYVERYDASIFSITKFAQNLRIPEFIMPPSIDPLSDKNRDLDPQEVDAILDQLNIPRDKPLVTQISRFDPFKDPIGVIRAFRLARQHVDCRLVLAGGGATDDPEGARVLARVLEEAAGERDIHILDLPPQSDLAINALQRASTVILQKSLREGFGLTVTEAMWKGKPVIGGAAGGITLQVQEGFTGYLVHSVEGAAYRIRYLLSRPELRERLGQNAREFVRRNFLITRNIRDYLLVILALEHPGHAQFEI